MKRYFTIYEEVKEQYYKIPKAFMLEESKYFEIVKFYSEAEYERKNSRE